jgi:hypothetical protein
MIIDLRSAAFRVLAGALVLSACDAHAATPRIALTVLPEQLASVCVLADSRGIGVQRLFSGAMGTIPSELAALGPDRAAQSATDRFHAAFDLAAIQAQSTSHLQNAFPAAGPCSQEGFVLNVHVEYELLEDLRVLLVRVKAQVDNLDDAGNRKKVPLYRNRFEYYSDRLDPAPELTQAEIDERLAKVDAKDRKARAQASKPLQREAKEDHLLGEWLAQDAKLLKASLAEGVRVTIEMLRRDIEMPALTDDRSRVATRQTIEAGPMRETVRKSGGAYSGVLVSQPLHFTPLTFTGVIYP